MFHRIGASPHLDIFRSLDATWMYLLSEPGAADGEAVLTHGKGVAIEPIVITVCTLRTYIRDCFRLGDLNRGSRFRIPVSICISRLGSAIPSQNPGTNSTKQAICLGNIVHH